MQRRRTKWLAVFALVAALSILAAACGGSGGGSKALVKLAGKTNIHDTKTASGSSIEIEMDDFYFNPTFVKATAGSTITVDLRNEGSAPHTFTTGDGKVDVEVKPDKTASVKVTIPQSGSLSFHCRFHQSSGMQGAFAVT